MVPHYSAKISFRAYFIDNWNGENLQVSVDGASVATIPWSYSNCNGAPSLCQLTTCDYVRDHTTDSFVHTASTFLLKFSAPYVSLNKHLGINSVKIVLSLCDSSCSACFGPSNTECSACNSGYWLQGSTCQTFCNSNQYKASGKCNSKLIFSRFTPFISIFS